MLSAVTSFSACLRRQVVYLVCGCMLSMCVRARQVHQARTHIDRQHYSHIPNKRRKQSEKVVTALSTEDDPLKMIKQL